MPKNPGISTIRLKKRTTILQKYTIFLRGRYVACIAMPLEQNERRQTPDP
jgi:hypothetical protein